MKKLMTSTIILLPLLILAIMLVSGAIMSLITHIYVEAVEFVQNGTLVLVMDDESAPPTKQLEVNVFPLKAENRDLVYTVEDESVVTVDESGAVTAQYFGETYITVTSAENKAAVDQLRVLVTDSSVHKVVMNGGYKTDLYEGGQEERTQALSVTVYPKEAENKSIEWTSSNEDVLHVSANGTVTLKGAGKATVKATSVDNPEAFASVEITCHKKIESIEIERKRVFTALAEAQFPQITKNPADADVKIAYTSSDDSIAKVDKAGNITFQKPGQVTVTATATDFGGKTAEVSNDYVSTLGYYRAPLFDTKQFTVDYDEYKNAGKALPIPFAPNLENTYRKVEKVDYSTEGVLTFDEKKETFTFTGAMPTGVKTLTATVTATGYDTTKNELVSLVDAFTLIVLRNAQSVAVAYKGTGDANSIVLAGRSLSFGTENAAAAVKVSPANHTNTVVYSLEGENDVATLTGGTLTFQKAGVVTVKISCLDENERVTASKSVTVSYAPVAKEEHQKGVEVTQPAPGKEPEKQQVLLSMNGENNKEEAVIYFTEPAGTQVTYEVTEGKDEVIDLKEEDGVHHIIPMKGGFATVQITVTKSAAPAGIALFAARTGEETTVYTIDVYVDKPVSADSFEVELGGKPCAGIFDTKLDEVSFTVKAASPNGELEGKLFYVASGTTNSEAEEDGLTQFSGAIAFDKNASTLTVTFGVKYSDKAISLGASGGLAFVTRTLRRNADSVKVSYQNTIIGADGEGVFNTTSKTLTFTTDTSPAINKANVLIEPATYTETIHYSLAGEGDNEKATLTTDGVLTFINDAPCSVTVNISLQTADGTSTLSTQITVHYNPRSSEEKVVKLPAEEVNIVLLMSGTATDKAKIEFNAPAGTTVDYQVSDGGVIALTEENNEQTITPKKGGFATVTVTVTPTESSEAEAATYNINIYVDRVVTKENFTVTFGEGVVSNSGAVFGTTLESVPFTVTLNCAEGAMQGKRLYVKYGATTATAEEGATTFAEEITFAETLGTLNVTFGVEYTDDTKPYKPAEGLETVTRTLGRNASGIAVEYNGVKTESIVFGGEGSLSKSLTLGEGNADVKVTVSPAAHTDVLTYSLADGANGVATLSASGRLTFTKAGKVTLVLQVKRGNAVSVTKEITVTYAPIGANVAVELGKDGETEKFITLLFEGEGSSATKEGVIYFTAPAGAQVSYKVKNDADAVTLNQDENGLYHIVPKKGGFATVEVTVDGKTAYTVNVYVDKPVSVNDFTVQFNGNVYGLNQPFLTSKTSLTYSVEVKDNDGSLAGKTVYIFVNGSRETLAEGTYTKEGNIDFGQYTTLTFTFGVQYSEKAQACGASGDLVSTTRKVETTKGNLSTAPTVTYYDGAEKTLQAGENNITLGDVGDEVVFRIAKAQAFSPSDFELTTEKVKVEGQSSFTYVTLDEGDSITLTLKSTQYIANEKLTLTVGGQSYQLKVTVHAKAQTVSVSFDGKLLDEQADYKTLLGSLTFTVTLGRKDDAPIFNKDLEWSLDETAWTKVTSATTVTTFKVTGITESTQYIHFRAADGAEGAKTFTLKLEQVPITQYTLALSVSDANGETQNLQEAIAITGEKRLTFPLSSDMQGTITLSVTMDVQGLLGGFGDKAQFAKLFPVNLNSVRWGLSYDADNGQIHLEKVLGSFRHEIYLGAGGYTVTLEFSRFQLAEISFPGFNSKTDNYRGYQQVRVFAKQSTYNGTDVDYFRMPIKPISKVNSTDPFDPSAFPMLSWKLTRQNDSGSGEQPPIITEIASQVGNTVTYGNAKYSVVETADGKYELQAEDGTAVVKDGKYTGSTRVTWVDAFSEAAEGYVRIYFGEFKGLSETDVQNDYFGNFGEQEEWKPAETHEDNYDKSGRKFKPSEGAFSFLRIEGGDGAQNGVNCHFNFNVLEGTDLYNVQDATSYYLKSKVVLHENLYGEGELGTEGAEFEEAEKKNLFLTQTNATWNSTDSTMLGKATVYGNGYQINLKAKNDQLMAGDPNNRNNSWGVSFGNLYNVFVKGTNQEETINVLRQKIVLIFARAYYCDLQGYTKGRPHNNSTTYIKNTVLHAASQSGFQLFYTGEKAYFENVTVVDCAAGITNENSQAAADHETNFYFKGNLDVLNYNNLPSLLKMASASENLAGMLGMILGDAWENFESFGKKCSDPTNKAYVNLVIYTSNTKGKFNFWNGNSYDLNKKESVVGDNVPMKEILDLSTYKSNLGGSEVTAWTFNYPRNRKYREPGKTYDYSISVDGRNFGSNTGTQYFQFMFTEERYIRLLCQYVNFSQDGTNLVKNDEHILWHMQQAYRDKSLLTDRKNDHMEALRESLTGKNITWPDGTTPEEAMQEYDSYQATLAAQMTALLSETVLPDKYAY